MPLLLGAEDEVLVELHPALRVWGVRIVRRGLAFGFLPSASKFAAEQRRRDLLAGAGAVR